MIHLNSAAGGHSRGQATNEAPPALAIPDKTRVPAYRCSSCTSVPCPFPSSCRHGGRPLQVIQLTNQRCRRTARNARHLVFAFIAQPVAAEALKRFAVTPILSQAPPQRDAAFRYISNVFGGGIPQFETVEILRAFDNVLGERLLSAPAPKQYNPRGAGPVYHATHPSPCPRPLL